MLTTTKTINQRTSELFGLIDHFGADVDLHDLVSGECIRPDAAAMFAGMQAGLVMATGLAEMKKKPTKKELMAAMLSGIETAATLFIRRKEREWDAMAEEVAAQESEGKDNA